MKRLPTIAIIVLLLASPVYAAADTEAVVTEAPVVAQTFLGHQRDRLKSLADEHPGVTMLSAAYVTSAMLDWHSTTKVLGQGGFEQNPLLGSVAGNSPAFLMVKSALAVTTLYSVQRIWKQNHKAAIVTLAAITVAQGFIDAHNYSLAGR
jgi:hypothetical protein